LVEKGAFLALCEFDNLYESANIAAKEKRYKNSVMKFFYNLEENIIQLQNKLIWKQYELGEFYNF